MKFILLAIFILFAAQPSQAYCAMCDGQDTGDSQQSSIQDGPMAGHGNGHQGDQEQGMDCCDSGSDGSDDGCTPLSHCGANTGSLAVFSTSTPDILFNTDSQQLFTSFTGVLNRTDSPPFRPPIA